MNDIGTRGNKKLIFDQTENELGIFIVTPFGYPAVLCDSRIRGYASSDYSDFALIDEAGLKRYSTAPVKSIKISRTI